MPSKRSWCCSTHSAHSPNHPTSGAIRECPAIGWPCSVFHSSSVGLPFLFRISAGTASLPTSCNNDAHRSRARSSSGRHNSSAITSLSARTRSECPRVRRSWLFRTSTSVSTCSAASCGFADKLPLRKSANTDSVLPELPTRSAIFSREGASSGNRRFIWHKLDNGTSFDAPFPTAVPMTEPTMNIARPHSTLTGNDQVEWKNSRPSSIVATKAAMIGKIASPRRIDLPSHGRGFQTARSL